MHRVHRNGEADAVALDQQERVDADHFAACRIDQRAAARAERHLDVNLVEVLVQVFLVEVAFDAGQVADGRGVLKAGRAAERDNFAPHLRRRELDAERFGAGERIDSHQGDIMYLRDADDLPRLLEAVAVADHDVLHAHDEVRTRDHVAASGEQET